MTPTRRCTVCGEVKTEDRSNFHWHTLNGDGIQGFESKCIPCFRKQKRDCMRRLVASRKGIFFPSASHKQETRTLPSLPDLSNHTGKDRRQNYTRTGKGRDPKEQKEFQGWGHDLYMGMCGFTGERDNLHAMHVWALKDGGPHDPRNCILVAGFLNTAWDAKLWALNDDYTVVVAPFMAGILKGLQGRKLRLDQPESHWPLLDWVRQHRAACLFYWAEHSTSGRAA